MERNLRSELKRLRAVTKGCAEDMHEPDLQSLKAHVIGSYLDNAFGVDVTPSMLLANRHELLVVLTRDGMAMTGGDVQIFNLADIIALARMAK